MFQISSKTLGFTIISAIAIAILIRIAAIEVFRIPTKAMTPALKPGDLAVVNKLSYGLLNVFSAGYFFQWSQIKRGDIIVFPLPDDPERLLIKRVIGLGGEKIELKKDGLIYINGELIEFAGWKNSGPTLSERLIPENHIFVVGDSPDDGTDSRHWGNVSDKTVIGRVSLVFSGNHVPTVPIMPLNAELARRY